MRDLSYSYLFIFKFINLAEVLDFMMTLNGHKVYQNNDNDNDNEW